MPGLLRGMARTAVVAGTATAVSNNVSRRQARRWDSEQQEQTYDEPPQQDVDDQISQLEQLGKLRDDGILTEQEFAAKKQQILGL
jgi:uncharacterized Zn finger protein